MSKLVNTLNELTLIFLTNHKATPFLVKNVWWVQPISHHAQTINTGVIQ